MCGAVLHGEVTQQLAKRIHLIGKINQTIMLRTPPIIVYYVISAQHFRTKGPSCSPYPLPGKLLVKGLAPAKSDA